MFNTCKYRTLLFKAISCIESKHFKIFCIDKMFSICCSKKEGNERLLFMFSEEWNIFKDPINYKLIIVVQVICKQQCLTLVKIELSHSRRIYSKGPDHFKLLYIKNLFNFTQNSKKGLNNRFNFLTGCLARDQFLPCCMSFKFQFYVNNKPVRTEI